MSGFTLQVVPCGGNEHRLDLQSFRSRGLPVPHHYSTWPLSSRTATWSWCRVLDPQGHLLGAYAIELTPSRALPGTRIGRVERLGRMLHAEALGVIGQALAETARQLPRLQRLDVHLFDEDARRRGRYSDAIMAAGGVARPEMFGYDRTLVVELPPSSEQLMATFSTSTRRNVRHASRQPGYVIEPIREASYVPRIRELAIEAFHRTGGEPGQLDVDGMLLDAVRGEESRLIGVFRRDGGPPGNLVAFAWGRLHGDYAVYEMGATHRAIELRRLSPGYGLVWSLMTWARERGARWFDLGGTLEAELAANHPLHGILSFKRGFSAEERVVAHEFSFGSDSLLSALARTSRDVARALGIRR